MPSSGYSFNPYDEYPASNYSGPSSEVDYFSASGFSTPVSGLDLFNEDNVSEPNLDWDPSLASFFDSVEASASGSGSNPSFLETNDFSPPEPWAAPCSGSNVLFLPANILPFDESALEFTGTNYGKNSTHSNAPFMIRCADLPPLPESSGFDADHPSLMTQEEMDDASEALEWITSNTVWLDKDVSSDFYIPPQPFPVTKNLKVVRLERVHGIPSQFPVPHVPTAYIVNFSSVRDSYKDANGEVPNLEKILKDKDCHSWDGTPGERQTNRAPMVNGQLFAALGQLGANNAQIMQRLSQGSIIQDKAICYVNTVRAMKCTGKDSARGACTGYQVLKEVVKATFPHLKEGKIYAAPMDKRKCEAARTILVPLDEETVPIAIVVPKHLHPHTHLPPPATKVPTDVRLLYE
ncbi:hypothetical protein B0H10DRAFT_2222603 [Mycena sp. CBHHK59/15]|nr:hypothetical protein B0H10DRAFT_2222603 [Mycena sp. CBHHK59/15]